MKLDDLETTQDDGRLQRVRDENGGHTFLVGRNVFMMLYEDGPTQPGAVWEVGTDYDGMLTASKRLGIGTVPTTTDADLGGLPHDFGENAWFDAGAPLRSQVAGLVVPPAYVVSDAGGSKASYGLLGGTSYSLTIYYGNAPAWDAAALGTPSPLRRLSLLLDRPYAMPGVPHYELLSSKFPGDPGTSLGTWIDVETRFGYRGPDTPFEVNLPQTWINQLASGAAGAIRLKPFPGNPDGLVHIEIGRAGSLSLHA